MANDTLTSALQQQTIAETPGDWSRTVTFAPFDPTLGTLVDVRVGVTGAVTGTASLENLGPTSGTDDVSFSGTVSVFSPDDVQISSVTATASGSAALGAFDGTDDYVGNSGTTLAGLSGTGWNLGLYQGTTSELALFSGHNPVPLTVDASMLFDEIGSGNLQAMSHASAGAVITLQYDYIPPLGSDSTSGSYYIGASYSYTAVATISNSNTLTTAPQTYTVADAPTGWSTAVSAAQFDPSLGTLDAVNITLTGHETVSVAAENLGTTAAAFGAQETPTLVLTTPDPTTYLRATPTATDSMSLAGYDGTADFAGTSGRTDPGLTATQKSSAVLTSTQDLAAFTGTGSIALPIYAFSGASLSGPADLLTQLLDQAGATVTISYTYTPAATGPGGVVTDGAVVSADDGAVFTDVIEPVVSTACFAAGTRIATDRGEVAVEHLRVGDTVRTVLGAAAAPIVWAGRREVDCVSHPHPTSVWPIRIAAEAFGPNRPHTDLFLSPDHAVYVNDVLIPIKHLTNGRTIVQVPVDGVTYHHIELAEHDVLLAQGLTAESFLDVRDASNYADRSGPVRLYPDHSARMWEAFGCAPLIVTGPQLAAARGVVAVFAMFRQAA